MTLRISEDGQFFIHRCDACEFERREPVDPERNPSPFEFIMHCYCGRRIEFDPDHVIEVQSSYIRAKWGRD